MLNVTKYIDWGVGIDHLGDEPMLRIFLQKFQQETLYASISTIVKNAKVQNWEAVRREAHSLKGSTGYIGATTCQKYASDLQVATQHTPVDNYKVAQTLNTLIEHAEGLQEYLSKTFSKPFIDPERIFTYRLSCVISSKLDEEELQKTLPTQKLVPKFIEKGPSNPDQAVFPSETTLNNQFLSPGNESPFKIQEIVPSAFCIHLVPNEEELNTLDETEQDAYDELNKQWRCMLI